MIDKRPSGQNKSSLFWKKNRSIIFLLFIICTKHRAAKTKSLTGPILVKPSLFIIGQNIQLQIQPVLLKVWLIEAFTGPSSARLLFSSRRTDKHKPVTWTRNGNCWPDSNLTLQIRVWVVGYKLIRVTFETWVSGCYLTSQAVQNLTQPNKLHYNH